MAVKLSRGQLIKDENLRKKIKHYAGCEESSYNKERQIEFNSSGRSWSDINSSASKISMMTSALR